MKKIDEDIFTADIARDLTKSAIAKANAAPTQGEIDRSVAMLIRAIKSQCALGRNTHLETGLRWSPRKIVAVSATLNALGYSVKYENIFGMFYQMTIKW